MYGGIFRDGKLCVVSSLDGRLRVWNLEEKSLVRPTIDPGPVEVWTVCFHPQGRVFATGSQLGHINIFSTNGTGEKPGLNLFDWEEDSRPVLGLRLLASLGFLFRKILVGMTAVWGLLD